MTRSKKFLTVCAVLLVVAAVWVIWSNISVCTTGIEFASAALPEEFDCFRIVHISDTHDCEFGKDNARLTEKVRAAEPDMIVITGDMVDSNRTDIAHSLSLGAQLAEIAPTYYVCGNHEALLDDGDYSAFRTGLKASGVTVLEDEAVEIFRGNASVRLTGLKDLGFYNGNIDEKTAEMEKNLNALLSSGFDIVLSHRPELFDSYATARAELIFCGHAHGGQVRIPFIGGVAAPGQGLFPEYDSGLYRNGGSAMIVSRGLGNSKFPVRINNRPEIVVVTLRAE